METAKRRLREEDLAVAEVAAPVRDGSASTFSVAFSRRVGLSPSRFAMAAMLRLVISRNFYFVKMQTSNASNPFSPEKAVSAYAENAIRMVPGMRDLPKMAGALLSECTAHDANILVVGAGGGLELKTLSEMRPAWQFCGVDPSSSMLDLAREALGPNVGRVQFHEGYVDSAPRGPYDGATCLLVLHFLPKEERLKTLQNIGERLKQGAPVIVVHYSIPAQDAASHRSLSRNAAFAVASGMEEKLAYGNLLALKDRLPILTPTEDLEILSQAGFTNAELFYSAFSFKGWVAYKA